MKLKVKETTIVVPAEATPNRRLWLSNLDLLNRNFYVSTVYLYKPKSTPNFFDAKTLKEALAKVLVPFYPVAGRLVKDENGRTEINCNGEGVLFVESETDIPMAELGDFLPTEEVQQLIPPIHPVPFGGISSQPLFLTQVTRFKCGGVCLGLGVHHHLADGPASLHFINSWSSIARGLSLGLPPILDRTFMKARSPPTPKFPHPEYHPNPPLQNPPQNYIPPTSSALVTITSDQITALKQKANQKGSFSTYEVLTAHIWRCTCKARELPINQETKLEILVDGRYRLNPPLPLGYLGNAIFHAAVIVPAGELLLEPIGVTAERIHNAIVQMDDEYLRSAIDYLEERSVEVQPRSFKSPNLRINSWSRLPFHEANFGWGCPCLITRASEPADGRGHLLPRAADGSISVMICLENDHLQSFEKIINDF